MSKNKKNVTAVCPYCRTMYRHKSMAEHCLKTKNCRTFNAPSSRRLNALEMQVGVGVMVQFVVDLLSKQKEATKDLTKKAQDALDCLFPEFNKLQCNPRYLVPPCSKMSDVLSELWPPTEDTDAIHMLSVAGALTIELRQDLQSFWEKHPDMATSATWLRIEECLDQLFEYYNEGLSEDYIYAERVPLAVEKLKETIWPAQFAEKNMVLRLFLVNDLYWVAAADKSQAKALVFEKHHCDIASVEAIQNTEVFEDGSTAATLLATANGHAAILAETGESDVQA